MRTAAILIAICRIKINSHIFLCSLRHPRRAKCWHSAVSVRSTAHTLMMLSTWCPDWLTSPTVDSATPHCTRLRPAWHLAAAAITIAKCVTFYCIQLLACVKKVTNCFGFTRRGISWPALPHYLHNKPSSLYIIFTTSPLAYTLSSQ